MTIRNIKNFFKQEKTYYSCSKIREAFNVHRSNKVTACSFACDDDFVIAKLDNYNKNFTKLIDDIKQFQNKIIELHKEGKAPKQCKKCAMFTQDSWENKVNDKFSFVVLNHYKTCNLRCEHCYHLQVNNIETDSDNLLVLELLKTLVEENVISDDFFIDLCGGEPSINKFIDDILRYCLDNNISVNINSNGAKLSQTFIEGVNKSKKGKPLFKLILTPDAGSKEVYKKIKGADFFDIAWQNIKEYCEKTNGKAIVKFIIEKGNINDVKNMIDMCVKNSVKNVQLSFDVFTLAKKDYTLVKEPINNFISLANKNKLDLDISPYVPKTLIHK